MTKQVEGRGGRHSVDCLGREEVKEGFTQPGHFCQSSWRCPGTHLHGKRNQQHDIANHRRIERVVPQSAKHVFTQ